LLGTETRHLHAADRPCCALRNLTGGRIMWIDLSAELVQSHRPVSVARVLRDFSVDTDEHETGSGVPSDG
jgi:hypothetical protein